MNIHRYENNLTVETDLDPMDDAIDWLASLSSATYLRDVLLATRTITRAEATKRAKRAQCFAEIAIDFVELAQAARPHVSFLPSYYAFLNLCKLMIACSDETDVIASGIAHGLSYRPMQKKSHSLFTENVQIWPKGVFPVLYKLLTNENLLLRKGGRYQTIRLVEFYSRLLNISAEFLNSQGKSASNICSVAWVCVAPTPDKKQFFLEASFMNCSEDPLPGPLPAPFDKWTQSAKGVNWESPKQAIASSDDFDVSKVVDRKVLCMPSGKDAYQNVAYFAKPKGKLLFPEEVSIFASLFHLSSIVRYKPEFIETIRDSNYWPMVLAARRHLLYRGMLLALSNVLQKNVCFARR